MVTELKIAEKELEEIIREQDDLKKFIPWVQWCPTIFDPIYSKYCNLFEKYQYSSQIINFRHPEAYLLQIQRLMISDID
jgi:hypothetical protein